MSARALGLHAELKSNLRSFDMRRDLLAVADLVELCFKDSLDADGRMYIRQMRRTAQSNMLLSRAISSSLTKDMPPGGFVWEEAGELVGNLSLIPVMAFGKRRYLIANVAVHPNQRRRGIASKLTLAALDKAAHLGAEEIWLQVDHNNAAAQKLYQQMGFLEMANRISWQAMASADFSTVMNKGIKVRVQRAEDWSQQIAWLKSNYPLHIQWNLPLNFKQFQPGFLGSMQRFFGDRQTRQWAAVRNGKILGVMSWQSSSLQADRLWMASDENNEEDALGALLPNALVHLRTGRNLLLNYPAARGEGIFRKMGFAPARHLIWMHYKTT